MINLLVNLLHIFSYIVIVFSCIQYKTTFNVQWLIVAILAFILLLLSAMSKLVLVFIDAYIAHMEYMLSVAEKQEKKKEV